MFQGIEVPKLGMKTVEGIGDVGDIRVAWFNNTEGNTLEIVRRMKWSSQAGAFKVGNGDYCDGGIGICLHE